MNDAAMQLIASKSQKQIADAIQWCIDHPSRKFTYRAPSQQHADAFKRRFRSAGGDVRRLDLRIATPETK